MRGLIKLPLEDTIDVATAARMARVSPATVRRWCDEGRVACIKPFGRWHIYRSQFLALFSSPATPLQLQLSFPNAHKADRAQNA